MTLILLRTRRPRRPSGNNRSAQALNLPLLAGTIIVCVATIPAVYGWHDFRCSGSRGPSRRSRARGNKVSGMQRQTISTAIWDCILKMKQLEFGWQVYDKEPTRWGESTIGRSLVSGVAAAQSTQVEAANFAYTC
jgi:hypothetical protein